MKFFARGLAGGFSSAHLGAHLIRGAAAAGLMYWGATRQQAHPLGALLASLAALVALRGCPMCWTVGLLQTLRSMVGAKARPQEKGACREPLCNLTACLRQALANRAASSTPGDSK